MPSYVLRIRSQIRMAVASGGFALTGSSATLTHGAGSGFNPPTHEANFVGSTLNGWGAWMDGDFAGNEIVVNDPFGKFSKVVRLHLDTAAGHADSNDFIYPVSTPGLPIQDLHVRIELRLPHPNSQAGPTVFAERKIFYFQPYDGAVGDGRYHIVLGLSDDGNGSGGPHNTGPRFSYGGFTDTGAPIGAVWTNIRVAWDTWWIIETRFKVNNSGQSNGIWQAWHREAAGSGALAQLWNLTGIQWATSAPFSTDYFRVGAQMDTFDDPGNEFRYLGRVAYSDQRIGP